MARILLALSLVLNQIGRAQSLIEIKEYLLNGKLNGKIISHNVNSQILSETRGIEIYLPHDYENYPSLGLLLVSDQMCRFVASIAEPLMLSNQVDPFIIVGINHRTSQPSDNKLSKYGIDYRGMEFHPKDIVFSTKPIPQRKLEPSLKNRHTKFKRFLINELIPFLLDTYNLSTNRTDWTLGGFSNGASLALSISLSNPSEFNNIIMLSPADLNSPDYQYSFPSNSPNFFLAAGLNEPAFLAAAKSYSKQLDSLGLNSVLQIYNSGHEFNMWLTAYEHAILHFYAKGKIRNCNGSHVEAMFPGGKENLYKFIYNHMKYPEIALKNGDYGTVYLSFTIEKNGELSNLKILKGVSLEIDQEALRIFKSMPNWIPASENCVTIQSSYTIPVYFRVN